MTFKAPTSNNETQSDSQEEDMRMGLRTFIIGSVDRNDDHIGRANNKL